MLVILQQTDSFKFLDMHCGYSSKVVDHSTNEFY